MSLVIYNGSELTPGQPDPLVSIGGAVERVGDNWGVLDTITLEGTLTGCSYQDLMAEEVALFNAASEMFKTLSISGTDISFPSCKMIDMSHDSNYLTSTSYSITFASYPSGWSLYSDGVSSPSDEITYQESPDRLLSISRRISAVGVNKTSSALAGNALQNAINYVNNRFDNVDLTPPFLIETKDFKYHLVEDVEDISRITSSFSRSKTYLMDADDAIDANIVLRYTKTEDTQDEGTVTRYDGYIDGGRTTENGTGLIRDKFDRFTGAIVGYMQSLSMNFDDYINRLDFSFDILGEDGDFEFYDIVPDIKITISENSESSLVSISNNIDLRRNNALRDVTSGEFLEYLQDADYFIEPSYDLYTGFYSVENGGYQARPDNIDFNPDFLSSGIVYNNAGSELSFSWSTDDRVSPTIEGEVPKTFDFSMSINPKIERVYIKEHCEGGSFITGAQGYNRSSVGVSSFATCATKYPSGLMLQEIEKFSTNEKRIKKAESSFEDDDRIGYSVEYGYDGNLEDLF